MLLITANEFFKTSWEAYRLLVIVRAMLKRGVEEVGYDEKSEPMRTYVNYGRWIIKCECGGAEKAWEEGVFMCQSCLNARHKHRYRHSVFPEHRREIEALLALRPLPNRNWNNLADRIRLGRDETVDDLKRENERHKDELLEVR